MLAFKFLEVAWRKTPLCCCAILNPKFSEHPTVSKWLASCDFSSVPDIDDFSVEEQSQSRMVYESVLGEDNAVRASFFFSLCKCCQYYPSWWIARSTVVLLYRCLPCVCLWRKSLTFLFYNDIFFRLVITMAMSLLSRIWKAKTSEAESIPIPL